MSNECSYQLIHLSQLKGKHNLNNSIRYFKKLPITLISYIQDYLDIKEHQKTFSVHTIFQKSMESIYSINSTYIKASFKYLMYLFQLERLSGENFNRYLNKFMSINIVSFPPKQLNTIPLDEQSKILNEFLTYRYQLTHNKSFMIDISSIDLYNLYYSVINKLVFRTELSIKLNLSCTINQPIKDLIPLFTIITPKKLKNRTSMIYSKIQTQIFEQQIEAYHYCIFNEASDNLEKADEYFTKYPNHLYSIHSSQTAHFAHNNQLSIRSIQGSSPYDLNEACKTLKLVKIKFQFTGEDFSEYIILEDYSNIETIGGFQAFDETECNEYLQILNKISRLKSLFMIELGEDSTNNAKVFQYFFNHISSNHKSSIEKIKMWFYVFEKGKDYTFIMENFPNLRVLTEDYDSSGLYDERFEIDTIFSCNASNQLQENDLDFLVFLLKNNMKNKIKGRKYFKMNLSNNIILCHQLIQHLNKENETVLLNSIHSINNIVECFDNKINNPFQGIKQMNYFKIIEENIQLIPLLKDVDHIIEIKLLKEKYFNENYEFIQHKYPRCIVYLGVIFPDLISKLEAIPSVKYLVLSDSQLPTFESQYYKPSQKLKVLSKYVIESKVKQY